MKYLFLFLSLLSIPALAHSEETIPVRKTSSGVVIIGSGDSVRAVAPFSGALSRGFDYAEAVNSYRKTFSDSIRVYCMIIPTAIAFYCPQEATQWTQDQRAAAHDIYSSLSKSVIPVDVFDSLQVHASEPIYSRTDHHWAPLGAYYAAMGFAVAADVPFSDLSTYDEHVVHNYVGTMYKFSRDISIRNAPEDFVYYTPRGVDYTTTSVRYQLNKNRRAVISESDEEQGPFFFEYADGSSSAYLTFMHGDDNTTTVETSTQNGRRLLILKDSFGNALPGYLFHSFEKICVVDCRYFTQNIADYVARHKITDILFANNISHAYTPATARMYLTYLEQ